MDNCKIFFPNNHYYQPKMYLQVYFHNDTHPEGYLTRTGKNQRPFVLSSGPYLYVKFETGEDLYSIPYVGFKAKYQFVNGKV